MKKLGTILYELITGARIYVGKVHKSGAAYRLPPGWSVSKTSIGGYDLVHSLGHTNYAFVATSANLAYCVITAFAGKDAVVIQPAHPSTAQPVDTDFSFILIVY